MAESERGHPEEIRGHYELGLERDRLVRGGRPRLEFARTMELLERFLPPRPAEILDVGGGPGTYAAPLARLGYSVHVVDPIPLHVEQAREAATQAGKSLTAALGDARALKEGDASVDAVLLLGPLYHLTEREERLRALAEARRVLRPGGMVLAAAISRFAPLLGGLFDGFLAEPEFRTIVERDLRDGQHRNPRPLERPEWFTSAFFHRPEELRTEVAEAGFTVEAVLGVEGPGWLDEGRWLDNETRELALYAARAVEAEPSLSSLSAHLLAVGQKR